MNFKFPLCAFLFSLGNVAVGVAQDNEWKLLWHDEFDQTAIDTSIWSKIPRGGSAWNKYMSDEDSLYEVKNGNLYLRGLKNNLCPQDTAQYITGGVYSKDKRLLEYGKIEIRAKLPNAQGCWPAIWMLPQNGQWPMGGEIDIMEHLNYDTFVYQTVHSNYTYILKIQDNPISHGTAPIDTAGYNIYGLEKEPNKLVFFVNGVKTFEYPRIETTEDGQYPFNSPYYLLLDMQLGGDWVGKINPTDLPVEMAIDWVRAYVK